MSTLQAIEGQANGMLTGSATLFRKSSANSSAMKDAELAETAS